jgi:hypothetical protein
MKPVLIGTNDPSGSLEPDHALSPDVAGNSGHRLLYFMNSVRTVPVTPAEYMSRFDRLNLVDGPWYDPRIAAATAIALDRRLRGRKVVLLGEQVRVAFGHDRAPLQSYVIDGQTTWFQIPHPSGQNRWYNDHVNRLIAGRILSELYDG